MTLHATCVAVDGRGLLILGPSGVGKSSLALQMMGFGARLVADDRVDLTRRGDALIATCPAPLRGLIEARGLGILRTDPVPEVPVALIADLARPPADRLPPSETLLLHGCEIDLVRAAPNAHFASALIHYLRRGRVA